MVKKNINAAIWLAIVAFIPAIVSCTKSVDPKLLELRKKIMLAEMPEKPITLTEAKELLAQENNLVLIGKIGTGKLDPFEKGKAVFVLSEAPDDHGDSADHDANECPFCRRRIAEAPLAQVEIQDSEGTTLPFGIPDLLGLKQGQIVVVQGRGHYAQDSDMLFIKGTAVFAKR
ncbi:MAG: hypothetical protein ABL921_18580 [Pirellula sp.]